MKIPLSNRLLSCCDFVRRGDRVADIGCDHGYLSIYLLKNGIAGSVLAADINEQPLQNALRNAVKYGVRNKITYYISDGVQDVPRDFDCMVCAGMGADTMISILSDAPWLKDEKYRLILQCQSKRPELRQWLYDNGYRIHRETLAKDGKFVYSVMEVVYGSDDALLPVHAFLSPQLLHSGHPLLAEYFERVKNSVSLTVAGMERTHDGRLELYRAILSDLTEMEATVYGDRS